MLPALRRLLWQPFSWLCRRRPLWPLGTSIDVRRLPIGNAATRLLGRLGGGFPDALCYLVDGSLLVDSGFAWSASP